MNKKLSVVILSLMICILIAVTTITVSAGTYIITSDWSLEIPSATNTTEYYVDEYLGSEVNVVIPKTYNDRTIVKINSNAITGVVETCIIPDTVTEISNNSFLGCETLKSITIPASVQVMGGSAFANCTSMESFIMKDKIALKYIPASCCSGNTSLKEAYIGYGVESIYNYAFKNCGSLEQIVIPPTVTTIYNKAFDGCDKLTIYGYDGSYALEYAEENNIPYVNLGVYVEPTEPTTSATEPTTLTEATTEATTVTNPVTSTPTDATQPTSVINTTVTTDGTEPSSVINTAVATDATEPSSAIVTTPSSVTTEPKESSIATTASTDKTEPSSTIAGSTTTDATEASAGETSGTNATVPFSTAINGTTTVSTTSVAGSTGNTDGTTSAKSTYYIGDADLDGRISVKDATKIQKHLAKMLTLDEIALKLADANNDTKVSVKDATQIQKFIAGFKDILYVGSEVQL